MDANVTNELLTVLATATDERKKAALRILRGELAPEKPVGPEPFLMLKEAGQRLNLHPTTLWKWGVPGHELGGKRRFLLSEIVAYLHSPQFKTRITRLRTTRRAQRQKNCPQTVEQNHD